MPRSRMFLLALLLLGCRKTGSEARPAPVAAPLGASAAAPAPKVDPVVDLLHTVDCVVAVSSKVENPHDFPEHLVDGKEETAWNGKTGDLKGWIAFRVPQVSHVTRVELSTGFDKRGPKGDLFTMNHRITRVRLTKEGRVVKEVDLDPGVRTPQGFDVDEAGGDFKLEVLATLPGTEKSWRELTVSELRVLGRAGGAPENPHHLPQMAIGSLDGVRPQAAPTAKNPFAPGPYPSIAALCEAYNRLYTPLIDAVWTGDRYPGKIEGPHCEPTKGWDVKRLGELVTGPVKSATLVYFHDQRQGRALVVFETDRGFSRSELEISSHELDDPGCMHGADHAVEDVQLIGNVVLARVYDVDIYWGLPDAGRYTRERAYACRVDSLGAMICDGPVVLGTARDGYDGAPTDDKNYRVDLDQLPWNGRKKAVLGPAGDLRAEDPK